MQDLDGQKGRKLKFIGTQEVPVPRGVFTFNLHPPLLASVGRNMYAMAMAGWSCWGGDWSVQSPDLALRRLQGWELWCPLRRYGSSWRPPGRRGSPCRALGRSSEEHHCLLHRPHGPNHIRYFKPFKGQPLKTCINWKPGNMQGWTWPKQWGGTASPPPMTALALRRFSGPANSV